MCSTDCDWLLSSEGRQIISSSVPLRRLESIVLIAVSLQNMRISARNKIYLAQKIVNVRRDVTLTTVNVEFAHSLPRATIDRSTQQPGNQPKNPNPCLVSESLLSKLIAQSANSTLAAVVLSVSELVIFVISAEGEDGLT